MTNTYSCACKFCGVELNVEVDDDYMLLRSGSVPILPAIPDLTRLAACNRCADYSNAKNRVRERMAKVAHTLTVENYANRGGSDAATMARETMRVLYEKWFSVVCDFMLIETQRDANFVSVALEHPEKWARWFRDYEQGCAGLAAESRKQPENRLPYAN